jgi:hypothetical protein
MKRMILGRPRQSVHAIVAFALAASPASVFCGDRQIAFERDQAVWITNLDGMSEKKIADGIFPAISPGGTRVAFKAVRVTGKDDYVWEPFWLTANEFLCITQKENEREPSIIGCRWTEKIRSCL